MSVGAGRFRIVRQLLTESVLLAAMGGALGILFAIWGIRFLTLLLANGRTNFSLHAGLNWHVLAAAAALSLVTGVLFGLAPALQATRVDVMPVLKEVRTGSPRGRHPFWRISPNHGLVVAQIGISLVMLFAAGLFVRTLSSLQSIELGFNRENVLLFQVDARKAGHKDPEIAAFYGDLRKRFQTIPGVREVSLSEDSLITAGTGYPLGLPGEQPHRDNRILRVGPAFFRTMQIPILAGRDFGEQDRAGSPAVVVINEEFAKASFPGRNPLGQRLTLRKPSKQADVVARDMQIIGIARNARYGGVTQDIPPVAYIPYDQGFPEPEQMVYAVRTSGNPLLYVNGVREIVRQADSHVPVSEVRTQAADIDQTINQEITFARLCSGFAMLALVIAGVGLYGTVSYNVARRTGEIGIRMALGAQRVVVVRMILREVLLLALTGLALGMVVAISTSRFVESLLYGIRHNDPLSLALAVISLLAVAALAGLLPALKASQIDLLSAIRHE
jgi:predicted permease